MPDLWTSEESLARELNVDRKVLRAERPHLGPGEVTQENGVVMWLRAAGRRVSEKLGLQLPEPEKTAATGSVEPPAPDYEELQVFSQALNPNIVNAIRANGEKVCVRVVDNRKYLPKDANGTPMKLKARRSEAGNWWVLVGREPRWPGRW